MKIIIAIAVLLNVYGVFVSAHIFNKPQFQDQPHSNPHPHHHHQHHPKHHHNDNYVNELTVDDLADVLLSLPGSLGRQAYKTFLSLGEFLPAETKAHKFFTSIPKAIRNKSKDEISQMRTIPIPRTQTQLSANPIFMMQPAGYNMMPLPLHPMFSSPSPLDYLTRVPCRHSKLIRVPLHTFDVQVASITRRFQPAQSPYDGESGESDDDDEDEDADLKDLLKLISDQDGDTVDTESTPQKSPENETHEKVDDTAANPSESNSNDEAPSQEKEKTPSSELPDEQARKESNTNEDTPKVTEAPPTSEESTSPTQESNPSTDETSKTPTTENQPSAVEEAAAPMEVELPKEEEAAAPMEVELPKEEEAAPAVEEVAPLKQEVELPKEEDVAQPKEAQSDELPENAAIVDQPVPKSKKKKNQQPKKGRKLAMEPETELTETPETEAPPAPASADEDPSVEAVAKPIQAKKIKRKKSKIQP